jgi:hypothetical protein
LALSSYKEITKLSFDSDFICLSKVTTLLALCGEWSYALSACLVAGFAIVILVIAPEAVRADLPTTIVELVVPCVAN